MLHAELLYYLVLENHFVRVLILNLVLRYLFSFGSFLYKIFKELVDVIKNDSLDTARKARQLRKIIKTCQNSHTSLEKCNKPVISAIHSHCVGAGISLVSCADIRYAVNDSVFSIRVILYCF